VETKHINEEDNPIIAIPVIRDPVRIPIELGTIPVDVRHIRIAVSIAQDW
jgi:hypothetical protein